MRAVSLRYFNVFGPRQDPSSEYSGVIARFMDVGVARATRQRRGPAAPAYVVYGDGRQSRDFVFVSDVVAANLLALDACLGDEGRDGHGAAEGMPATDVDGAVLNVGSGVRVDVLEIVAEVERLSGGVDRLSGGGEARDGGSATAPIDFRAPREGDIRASQADVGRARRLLGYEPAVSFADGLAATYRWYAGAGVS